MVQNGLYALRIQDTYSGCVICAVEWSENEFVTVWGDRIDESLGRVSTAVLDESQASGGRRKLLSSEVELLSGAVCIGINGTLQV